MHARCRRRGNTIVPQDRVPGSPRGFQKLGFTSPCWKLSTASQRASHCSQGVPVRLSVSPEAAFELLSSL